MSSYSVEAYGTSIFVMKGDITRIEVDAIVNAANSYLTMGGGVAGAIKRSGGHVIEEEAVKTAPVEVGRAVHTGAGRLKARFVIHAPTMEVPGPTTVDRVLKATRAALEHADEIGVTTIAFPGFGTGVGNIPPKKAAEAMVNAIGSKLKEGGLSIKKIILTDIDERMVKEFKDQLNSKAESY